MKNKNRIIYKVVSDVMLAALILFFGWFVNCLPQPLFNDPNSLVVNDRKGNMLGAQIAEDGQWRFPAKDSVTEKFAVAIIAYEDKRFYSHPGIDVFALARAVKNNIMHGKKAGGASTLSMQVIRMARKNKPRIVSEKIIEMIMAVRLELAYSKHEVLSLYAANAPFGGNVVGLETASWRYYGKPSKLLSWSEAATLAVLPNSPSLIHPGKNRERLLDKRNFLLNKLVIANIIDKTECELAKWEPLPEKPMKLPFHASHLVSKIALEKEENSSKIVTTTLDKRLQKNVNAVVQHHSELLSYKGIYNVAAIVADVRTGNVMAYTGNSSGIVNAVMAPAVDMIQARRSTGSVMKPLLYAFMLNDGYLLPKTLIQDVPSYFNTFTPKNYTYTYDGIVPADRAISRSLNIPAINMLQQYTPARLLYRLKQSGITTMNMPAEHYGLSLILGGAEATLWELAGIYASMSRTLNNFNKYNKYDKNDYSELNYYSEIKLKEKNLTGSAPVLSAGAIYSTFEAMARVSRPDEEKYWHNYSSSQKIAWKTGTSFGFRDAWAIGTTPDHVVAVWVGNANGEGRPGLTGLQAAAPAMFEIFNLLPTNGEWFTEPVHDMQFVTVCSKTGFPPNQYCEELEEIKAPKAELNLKPCPYHQQIILDKSEKWIVNSNCETVDNIKVASWFVLPPAVELFYKKKHTDYKPVPPARADCVDIANKNSRQNMELIYPANHVKIYIPVDIDGKASSTVFEVAHRNAGTVIYWHLDEKFIGSTKNNYHRMTLNPSPGRHKLTLIDNTGEKLVQVFEIVNKKNKNSQQIIPLAATSK